MRSFFARLDEKHKLLGNFEKILKFFDENSLEKLNFLFLFFTKNRAFGNNTIFLQQFFRFRGGGGNFPPFPPWLRPWPNSTPYVNLHSLTGTRMAIIILPSCRLLLVSFWIIVDLSFFCARILKFQDTFYPCYACILKSVKLSGHRDSTTHRKKEGNIFHIMLGPSPPAPITIFKNISEKLQSLIWKFQLFRCPGCLDNFTPENNWINGRKTITFIAISR